MTGAVSCILNLAGVLSTHRVYVALFAAYLTFFFRVYHDSSDIMASQEASPIELWTRTGENLTKVDPKEPALTMESAVGRRPRGSAARRALTEDEVLAKYAERKATELGNETIDVHVLEGMLQVAAATPEPERRGQQLAAIYGGLGRQYSAHARYFQALHAMDLAAGAAEDSGSGSKGLTGAVHIDIGQIELQHHRYYAAGTRFDDALRYTDALPFDRVAALRSGRGWAALMHQGAGGAPAVGSRPEADFTAALVAASKTYGSGSMSGPSPILNVHCAPEDDGLDTDRVLSFVGLGLIRRSEGPRLFGCAGRILRGPGMDAHAPRPWDAVGLGFQVLGRPEEAAKFHRRAFEQHAFSREAPAREGLLANLPAYSHSALYLGLAESAAGRREVGQQLVEGLVESAAAAPAEVAEWLTRFAHAHTGLLKTEAYHDFAALLFRRATGLLQQEGQRRVVRHLTDFARFLMQLRPARARDALEPVKEALLLLGDSPDSREAAKLHNLAGSAHHQLGELVLAEQSFDRALEADRRGAELGSAAANVRLMVGHANIGATQLQTAGRSSAKWKAVVRHFEEAARLAKRSGLETSDPRVRRVLETSRNALRLAHRRGLLMTCPGPLEELIFGPTCIEEDAP